MEKQSEPLKLPADVAEKFATLEGHGVGEYHFNGKKVELDKISADEATNLFNDGFPYLVEKVADNGAKRAKAGLPEPALK